MTEFFSSVRGALSVYCSSDDGQLTDARFVLARFGEDPDKVATARFEENGAAEMAWKAACEAHKVPWNAHKAAPGWKAQATNTEATP